MKRAKPKEQFSENRYWITNDKQVTYEALCKSLFSGEPVFMQLNGDKKKCPIIIESLKVKGITSPQFQNGIPGFLGASDIGFSGVAGNRLVDGIICFLHDGRLGRALIWFRKLYRG